MTTLFDRWVIQGGVMMIGLIPCLILTIAFVIQGFLNLRPGRLAPRGFAQQIRRARETGGVDAARALINDSHHSLAEIIRNVDAHLAFNHDADPADILRQEIEAECDVLLQQNSQLGLIYRVAPLMGLLGTVFGMLETFGDFTGADRPDLQQLSQGINVALITTAWGLSIAIPSYIALYLMQRRIANFEQFVFPREGGDALHALLDRPVGRSSAAVRTEQRG